MTERHMAMFVPDRLNEAGKRKKKKMMMMMMKEDQEGKGRKNEGTR